MDESYKISLGVDIDVGDLQSQINKAGDKTTPIPIKVEIENLAEVKKQIQSLGKSDKNTLTLDTTSLENSLKDVKSIIADIKTSIGTLDGKSGMKSLLSSINQISSALDKASGKFDELNAELKSLSGKDFNINFGINMGKSNSFDRNTNYGIKARNETLPQLKKQAEALQDYLKQYYKVNDEYNAILKLTRNSGNYKIGGEVQDLYTVMSGYRVKGNKEASLTEQMDAYKKYISIIKEYASLNKIDLSHITSGFSKSADQLVQDANDVRTGANEMEENFERLKQIFGGNNNFNVEGLSTQLDSIVVDLGEIRKALESLSSVGTIDGLTTSFKDLSEVLDKLVANVNLAKNAFGEGLNATVSGGETERAIQAENNLAQASTQTANTVVQNGERVEQAYREMAEAADQVSKIKIGDTELDALNLKDDIDEADRFAAALSKLKNIQGNIGKIEIGKINTSDSVQQLNTLETQLESLSAEYNETVAEINSMGGVSQAQWQSLRNQIDTTGLKLDQCKAKIADTKEQLAQKIKLRLETGDFSNQVNKIESDSHRLSGTYDRVEAGVREVKQALTDMRTASLNDNTEDLIAANERYERSLKDVKNQLDINAIAEKDAAASVRLDDSRKAFQSNIDAWLTKNSAAAQKFGSQMLELKTQAKSCDQVTLNHLRTEFKRLDKEAEAAGLKMQSFGDRLRTQFSKYSSYFSIASVFMYAGQGLRDMFNQVVAIDTAMTELKKVTDETDASYNKFLSNAASRSKELGTTIDGLVESTADFARLGYGFEESQGLAEVANIYAVVGDEIEGVEDATKSLISTLEAYKDEASGISDADFAMDIVDKFNEVSNNFAISSGGIGEAMQRSASSLRAANNTIDESIALITAANTVVQDPVTIGTSFKTISMRIRGAKSELEEAGLETDGMVESTAKLRQEILALSGVDIMENNNTFKSTYAIMDELARKWKDLSDIQQASITELIAGKRQGNVVSSLMQNFDIARNALKTSLNSSGSAMAEHAKWSESLEARLNKLKSTWQSLSQSFLKSDFLKSALNAIIGLVDAIDWLIDNLGTIPTLLTAFTAFKSFSGKGIFKTIKDEATGAATGITSVFRRAAHESTIALQSIGFKGNSSFMDSLKGDIAAINKWKAELNKGAPSANAFNDIFKNASTAAKEFAKSNKFATEGVSAFIKQQQLAEVSTLAQNKSLGNANAIIKEYFNGCKTVGVGQKEFADAVSKTNPQLGKQLTSAKGAKSALVGYGASLVGATIKTIALEAATMALNAAVTMGISALVTWAVQAIDKLITTSSELAEEVDEVTSKYKEQHGELQELKGDMDTDNESSMISKYAKLSKGVDSLGRNVSLTAEEYSEYQGIVNSIADQIPSLISGYDEQGNALLSCKDNVEKLTEAYENLIKAQNNEVLNNAGKIGEDFANKVEEFETSDFWTTTRMTHSVIQDLKTALDEGYAADEFKGIIDATSKGQIRKALEDAGYDVSTFYDWWSGYDIDAMASELESISKTNPKLIQGIIDNFEGNLEEATSEMKTIAQAALSDAFDLSDSEYYDMSDTMKGVVRNIVNGFDYEFYKQYKDNPRGIETYINDMLGQLKALGDGDVSSIETAFDLQTQFNGGEISYGEYVGGLKDIEEVIDSLDLEDEIKQQLKISLGLDDEGVIDQYNALVKKLSEDSDTYDFKITEEQAKSLLGGLSSEELAIAVDVITKMENNGVEETIDEVRAAIDRELTIKGLTLELDIEVEKAKLEALTTALTESFSGSGLGSDSISAVEGMFSSLSSYDPSKLFERTANGIHLNNDELRRLNSESKKTNLAKINKEMDSLGDIYNQTREELYQLTYGTDEYNTKAAELSGIEERIKKLEQLGAQYEGLASAYQEWQMAESAGSQRDMYETMLEGWENVGDEISRGWIDDGTREFLELLKGETVTIDGKSINVATASTKELKKIWKSLDDTIKHTTYSVRDFFTVDDEGNSTADGVYNFLDAIGQMEEEKFGGKDVVQRDKNGKIIGFNFELVGGDEVIAEALGVSEELVQIMKRAADDAGFVVSFDGTYQQLDVLREKAQLASETLNKVLKEKGHGDKVYSYNFNSNDEKDITKQLANANKALNTFKKSGKIDLSLEGAEEALTVASTLQSMLDKLQRPAYMQIEVSQVEKDLQEPLRNLQELRTLIETEHQLKLSGADTSQLVESKQKIYDYFEELDPEIKAKVGLVDAKGNGLTEESFNKLTGEQKIKLGYVDENGKPITDFSQAIQKKLNDGDIAIEATVDIQMEMDEKLGILVDKALYDAGIIDKEEFTKRVNVYLEADVDNDDAKEETENAVNEVTDGDTKREKNVQIIADVLGIEDVDNLSSKLEGLDDKTIQAIAEVLGGVDVDKLKLALGTMTDVQVKAIAEAIGKGDVEGLKTAISQLDPKTVQAIAQAFGYSDVNELIGAIDNLDPKTVQAVAQALGLGDVNTLQITVNNMQGNTVDAKVNTDGQASKIDTLQTKINSLKGKIVNVGVQIASGGKKKAAQRTGADPAGNDSEVNGTAHVGGTTGGAFKQGSWGTKNSGTALVGELGREILVRDGRYYTIGDNGAEFIKYKKGDIIFNHIQSEELFRNGKVTADGGRARAFVQGTAFDTGTGGGEYGGTVVGSNDKDKFEETFDWLETRLSRLEGIIDKLDQAVNNVYDSWDNRNKKLDEEITANSNLISNLQKAVDINNPDSYLAAANAIDLDNATKQLVREGAIDPDDVEYDEATAKKIKEYKELYEKYLDADDKLAKALITQAELNAQKFDNVIAEYEGILQAFEHTESMLDEYINQAEAKGHLVSKNYYQELINNKNGELAQLEDQRAALLAKRQEYYDAMIAQGMTDEEIRNSEQWKNMCADIDDVTQSIEAGETATIEWSNAMRDIDWQVFDLIQERISDVAEEADFLIDLMSNDKLHNDDGSLTDKGMATMGLHAQNYNTHMYAADEYGKEIAKIDSQIASGELDGNSLDVINRRRELVKLQRESILAAEDEKQAIKDLVEEGINLELDALQERIDLHNEEIDSMKDLYDYQKKVKEQSEEIASLEKQRAAYLGDDSEESRAKLQEITVSLKEAKENLQETEYDKYISDQSALLDSLYEEYELILNERLDNVDTLIGDVITEVNNSASTISNTLTTEATNVGTTLSEAMKSIWSDEGAAQSVIAEYGSSFQNKQTTTNLTLDSIKSNIDRMVDDVDKDAQDKVNEPKTNTSATPSSAKKVVNAVKNVVKSAGDGKPKVGDKVKFVSGKYYYDSQGVTPAGSKNHGKQVYITNINTKSWATHPYHISTGKKLGSGDLGWLKLSQISGYATGKKNFLDNEIAWTQEKGQEFIVRPSDGAILTPIAKGDSVLNANASSNIWDMANSPADFIKDNLKLGTTNSVPNNANISNSTVQNFENITFSMPNVRNYEQLLSEMQKDKSFEKLILAMTVDRIAGGSSLAKNKSIRK